MTWVKLDDRFAEHPKIEAAGPTAAWLHVCGLCYCSANLTDGFIPKSKAARLAPVPAAAKQIRTLVQVGLWEEVDGGYQIHDYLEYQPSADKVRADREAAASRQRHARERAASRRDKRPKSQQESRRDKPVSHGPPVPGPVLPPPASSAEPSVTSAVTDAAGAAPDEELWPLLAQRRMRFERDDQGTTITHPAGYLRTVEADYRDRLKPTAAALRFEHPDWSIERLADELDPQLAERNHAIPDADATRAWIDEHTAHEGSPMPDDVRAEISQLQRARRA